MSLAERSNLQARTYLAEQLGATIVTVPGDDVPYQIAEFARLSKVTKVVMGRSNAPNRLLPYKPLNEKLIERAPELDIYIIPDISGKTPAAAIRRCGPSGGRASNSGCSPWGSCCWPPPTGRTFCFWTWGCRIWTA